MQFEWFSVTYNPDFKVTIIQRKITRKWYNIEPTADQQKVVYDLSNDAIFNYLERPLPPVSRSLHSLTLNISEMVRDTDSFKRILVRTYTRPTITRSVALSLCNSWASCLRPIIGLRLKYSRLALPVRASACANMESPAGGWVHFRAKWNSPQGGQVHYANAAAGHQMTVGHLQLSRCV